MIMGHQLRIRKGIRDESKVPVMRAWEGSPGRPLAEVLAGPTSPYLHLIICFLGKMTQTNDISVRFHIESLHVVGVI